MKAAGFNWEKTLTMLPQQHFMIFRKPKMKSLLLFIFAIFCHQLEAENWNRFRGPSGNGQFADISLPLAWKNSLIKMENSITRKWTLFSGNLGRENFHHMCITERFDPICPMHRCRDWLDSLAERIWFRPLPSSQI